MPRSCSVMLQLLCHMQMVLAGHKPETVMEICSRALSFWTYQVQCSFKNQSYKVSSIQRVYLCALPQSHQERAYQEFCASKAMEKAQEQETYYQQSMAVPHH